jgi:hypothetical protein
MTGFLLSIAAASLLAVPVDSSFSAEAYVMEPMAENMLAADPVD